MVQMETIYKLSLCEDVERSLEQASTNSCWLNVTSGGGSEIGIYGHFATDYRLLPDKIKGYYKQVFARK